MNSKTNSQKTVLEADPLDQPLAKRARISNEESVETDISDEFNAIAKSPGLQHIATDIFKLLDKESLMNCRSVNHAWKNIMDQPMFWLNSMSSNIILGISRDEFQDQLQNEDWECSSNTSTIGDDSDDEREFEFDNLKEIVKNWKELYFKKLDHHTDNEFVLVLMKMYNNEPKNPLEVVVDLKNAGKCQNLMKFIVENTDPFTTARCNIDFNYNPDIYLDGLTPIHLAAWCGLTESVKHLIKIYEQTNNFDVNSGEKRPHPALVKSKQSKEFTAIHLAAIEGHADIVEILVHLTDNPNAPLADGNTPIWLAATYGHLDIVKQLAAFTETPNAPNHYGDTPQHDAVWDDHLDIVKFLVESSDDPNPPNDIGCTPLHNAATGGALNTVKYLVGIGANPMEKDIYGITSSDNAKRCKRGFCKKSCKHKDVVEFLENYINSKMTTHGKRKNE